MSASGDNRDDRPLRADARRNRAALIAAGKAAFAAKGADASLEEVARAAGVGIGTLYRHFPTRDALIEAVYQTETDALATAATRLAASEPPVAALRAWLGLFVDYMITKQGMIEVLRTLPGGPSALYAASGTQLTDAVRQLADRAVDSGAVVLALDPVDLLRALAGPSDPAAAHELVKVLVAGMEAQARADGAGDQSARRPQRS